MSSTRHEWHNKQRMLEKPVDGPRSPGEDELEVLLEYRARFPNASDLGRLVRADLGALGALLLTQANEVECAVDEVVERPEDVNAAKRGLRGRRHTNGLALCKIHHIAYDQNFMAIRPDYTVEISRRLLEERDGPMLRHGLQEHHGRALMRIPARRADRPDTDRLMERYQQFLAA